MRLIGKSDRQVLIACFIQLPLPTESDSLKAVFLIAYLVSTLTWSEKLRGSVPDAMWPCENGHAAAYFLLASSFVVISHPATVCLHINSAEHWLHSLEPCKTRHSKRIVPTHHCVSTGAQCPLECAYSLPSLHRHPSRHYSRPQRRQPFACHWLSFPWTHSARTTERMPVLCHQASMEFI